MSLSVKRIGVVLPTGPAYFTRVFAGIGEYVRGRRDWQFVTWPTMVADLPGIERAIREHRIDGVLGQASDLWQSLVDACRGSFHFVNVEHSAKRYPRLPRVGIDEDAVAKLASEHFRPWGIKSVAVVGEKPSLPAQERSDAFVKHVARWCAAPARRHVLEYNPNFIPELEAWIAGLPRPMAIWCWNDETMKHVHQACLATNLRIPEDAAILGTDNDETICRFLHPMVSSIDINPQRVGYEAAALLDRLIDGKPAPRGPILIPPIGVVARESTEMLGMSAPDVLEALRFIRERAHGQMTVDHVVDHVAVSRRSLERQFREALGRSPRSEIQRVLVERAKDLLANTDLSLPSIAQRCGYPRPNHFTTMFRKQTGQTPSAYRKRTRLTG